MQVKIDEKRNMKIKVGFLLPLAKYPSTLYRALMIMDEMIKQNEIIYRINSIDEIPKLDINILYVQRLFDLEYVQVVSSIKKRGILVIYDIVDNFVEAKDMLEEVDAVTTDSSQLVHFCEELTNRKLKICITEDPIRLRNPLPPKVHSKKNNLEIVFFANPCNLDCIEICKNALLQLRKEKQFNLTYISGNSRPEIFEDLNASFIQWNLSTFTQHLSQFDLAIIPQKLKYKGINKLIEGISHNLPVISSDVPVYREFAEQTNTTEFLCKNDEEWYKSLMKMFNPDSRNLFLSKTLDYVWRNYNVSVITKKYIDFFYQLLREKKLTETI